jgi:hypothetical protein
MYVPHNLTSLGDRRPAARLSRLPATGTKPLFDLQRHGCTAKVPRDERLRAAIEQVRAEDADLFHRLSR